MIQVNNVCVFHYELVRRGPQTLGLLLLSSTEAVSSGILSDYPQNQHSSSPGTELWRIFQVFASLEIIYVRNRPGKIFLQALKLSYFVFMLKKCVSCFIMLRRECELKSVTTFSSTNTNTVASSWKLVRDLDPRRLGEHFRALCEMKLKIQNDR